MREIKFRLWDAHKNKFIPKNKWVISQSIYNSTPMAEIIYDWEDYIMRKYCYYPEQILMQFTGLKDKNGREIYEGDILSLPGPMSSNIVDEVIWNDKKAKFDFKNHWKEDNFIYLFSELFFEVIGNIYENPELIKIKKDDENAEIER